MRREGAVGLGRLGSFLVDRPGRDGVRSGDQVDRLFSIVGPPPAPTEYRSCPTSSSCTPVKIRARSGGSVRSIPGSSLIFAGLSVVAAIVILLLPLRAGAASSRVLTVALGLIMAGAMGNCYDRLAFGYVRDFVHFHVDAIGFDCAIFNFADNMLVAGALTLVLYALRPEKSPEEQTGTGDGHSVEETMRRPAGSAACPAPPSQSMHAV